VSKIIQLVLKYVGIPLITKWLKAGFYFITDFFSTKKTNKENKKKVEDFKNAKTKDAARDGFSKLP
jgi:hypothetical protein